MGPDPIELRVWGEMSELPLETRAPNRQRLITRRQPTDIKDLRHQTKRSKELPLTPNGWSDVLLSEVCRLPSSDKPYSMGRPSLTWQQL
jgi:hypothetical protein